MLLDEGCLMRVYEVAKRCDVRSKDVILFLEGIGVFVKSHMSQLDQKTVLLIEKKFTSAHAPTISSNEISFEKDQKINPVAVSSDKIPEESSLAEKKMVKAEQRSSVSPVVKNNEHEERRKNSKQQQIINKNSVSSMQQKKTINPVEPALPLVKIHDLTVEQFAKQAHVPATQVIVALLKWGMRVTKNQIITKETVVRLARHFSVPVAEIEIKKEQKIQLHNELSLLKNTKNLQERPPVVVVVGHVDHGKTTLLDFIRKTKVAVGEKGGITQHLGAYEVRTALGTIVFLDTPGHEAFSKIRQRGVRVADIAVLVVAADDGIKPQTIEAIKIIQEMQTPIVVALNKIDKVPESQIDVVKQQLMQYGVVPEEWGGETIVVPISAKTGLGVDTLLEMIALQAQIMELRAEKNTSGVGYVLESKLEKGKGSIATIILQNGRLSKNDYFLCGSTVGHVNSIIDTYNHSLNHVEASIPVQISGFEKSPHVGDTISVISKEEYLERKSELRKTSTITQPIVGNIAEGSLAMRLILKADNNSSREALVDALEKLFKQLGKQVIIVSSSIGTVSEGDIELAHNTGAEIFGLHTKMDGKTAAFANQKGIEVHFFDIIYRLLDVIKEKFESRKQKIFEPIKIGQATVIKVFNIPKVGEVAGCHINTGKCTKGAYVVAYRGNEKIGESKVVSIQKEKETIAEARAGFECGIVLQDRKFGFQEQDRLEFFIQEEKQ